MSKLEKLNIYKKYLVVFSLTLLVCMVVGILMILPHSMHKEFNAGYQARNYNNYNCLKKGEVCTQDDIDKAIKVKFQVNDEKAYDFYLIANDTETATFLMAENLKDDVDWHLEGINFRGPSKAIKTTIDMTKDWYNMPIIDSYIYEDYGNRIYHQRCDTVEAQISDLLYDCAKDITPARGFKNLTFDENGLTVNFNIPDNSNMTDHATFEASSIYARMPSLEEIMEITPELRLPDWVADGLEEGEGFWTMSSSTSQTYNYNMAAYAVVNYKGIPRVIELMTMNEMNKTFKHTGIRPVVTIQK